MEIPEGERELKPILITIFQLNLNKLISNYL